MAEPSGAAAGGAIAEADVARLIKLLGMLGSDQPGERASAALRVVEWLAAHQVTWEELLTPVEPVQVRVSVGSRPVEPARAPYTAPGGSAGVRGGGASQGAPGASAGVYRGAGGPTGTLASWRQVAQALLDHYPQAFRGTKEIDFVASRLAGRWPTLSPKQEDWLRDIAARVGLSW